MVQSYISAMKAVLKMNDIDVSEDQYLLASMTRASKLKNDKIRTRLPIQKGMLTVILRDTTLFPIQRSTLLSLLIPNSIQYSLLWASMHE